MNTGRDTPIGLRLSAVLLVVSGAVLGTFVVAVSALMIRRWILEPTLGNWSSIGWLWL
jgi:hypothetical protein